MNLIYRIKRHILNFYVMQTHPQQIDLWVDDLRPAPFGWYHAVNYQEAIRIFNSRKVDRLALDHDLGETKTGYDFVKYIVEKTEEETAAWPKTRPFIITSNPVGRANMSQLINRYGPYSSYDFT